MNLSEAFPRFSSNLSIFQPRLDRNNETVETMIQRIKNGESQKFRLPLEIQAKGIQTEINFLYEMGWVYISEVICELYQ